MRAIFKSCLTYLLVFTLTMTMQAQSGMINIDHQVMHPTACNLTNGTISISPLDGVAPFQYSIDGGATFQSDSIFTDLGIGTYILLVRDAQQQISSFILAKLMADGAPVIRGIVMSDPLKCGEGGSIKILAEEGIGALQYSIDSGATFQVDPIFSDLAGGFYHIIVQNEDGSCPYSYPTISFAPQSPVNFLDIQMVITNPECETTTGEIMINVTGGSGDYLFSMDNGNTFQAENTFSNLGAGTYTLMVRDTLTNCDKEANTVAELVDENCQNCDSVQIETTLVHPNCDSLNGSISILASGGSGDYLYSVNDGLVFQNAATFTGLAAGAYQVKIRDVGFDCEKSEETGSVLTAIDCPNCDSLDLQSFLNLPSCDASNGRIELMIGGGSGDYSVQMNSGAFQPLFIFENLAAGSYNFTVRDNATACEKAFSPIILAEDNCACSLDAITPTNLAFKVNSCDSLAEVCLDIPLADLMDLELLDNGQIYTGGLMGCDFDTLLNYLYFTLPGQGLEGPYHLDRWELNDSIYTGAFADINDLVNMMNQYDPNANWERDSLTMMLTGGFPGNRYGSLEITQINTNMAGAFQLNKNYIPMGSQIALSTGRHELVFRDKETNCTDTLVVDVACQSACPELVIIGAPTTIISDCDGQATFCIGGAFPNDLSNFRITDNGLAYMGTIDTCRTVGAAVEIALDTGMHTLAIANLEEGCQYIFQIEVMCPSNVITIDTSLEIGQSDTLCFPDYFMEDIVSIMPTCEGESPAVGFEINNLNNCLYYEGLQEGIDTLCISVCIANDSCLEVVIIVTVSDPDSSCASILNHSLTTLSIEDCEANGQYCLNIPKTDLENYNLSLDGMEYTDPYVDCDVPEQASLALPVGTYQLLISEKEGECRDSVTIEVLCEMEDNPVFEDTLMVMEMDTFCIDKDLFTGDTIFIENTCDGASGESVIFEIDPEDGCIYYTAVEIGTDSACIVACDELGTCDTTIIIVTVEENDTIAFPIAINDVDTVTEGGIRTINVLGNDTTNSTLITVVILDQPQNGTVIVNEDMTITYTADPEHCETTENFTYELCNPRGCDTASVAIYIECKQFEIYTGFSPNGDGINDTFTIDGLEDFPNNNLRIYNRWGTMVYEQAGYKGQWDGTWNGQILPDGTYFYILDDGEGTIYSGYVEIRR